MFEVGCFSWYSDDLLNGIAAATVCAMTGQRSLDNVKRRYLSSSPRERFCDHDAPAKTAVRMLDDHMKTSFQSMQPRRDSSLQTITFDQAMVRAFTMIKNCLMIARRGYVFESALIARGCIEQICWARGASRALSEEDLLKIKVQKEVTHSKTVYSSLGRFYGELSQYSHFDARLHSLFYTEDEESLATLLTNRKTKFVAMQWSFVLIDLWGVVFEEFYRNELSVLKFLRKNGELRKARFAEKLFSEYFGSGMASRRREIFPI